MQTLIILALLAALGGGIYIAVEKPFQKREGEFTLQDLMRQSEARSRGEKTRPLNEVSPANYQGSLLAAVSLEDQKKFRETAAKATFAAYIPTKVPPGLAPLGYGSSGKEFGINKYQIYLRSKSGDSLLIYEYQLHEYLSVIKKTITQYFGNAKERVRGDKKIYVSRIGVITDPKYLYTQAVSVVAGSTFISAEYRGEKKLSEGDMEEIGASFVR